MAKRGPKANPYFRAWYEAADCSRASAFRLWSAYASEAGAPQRPGKATAEQIAAFAAWFEASRPRAGGTQSGRAQPAHDAGEIVRLQAELAAVWGENERLRLENNQLRSQPRSGDRIHEALAQVRKLARQTPRGDPASKTVTAALDYLREAEGRVQYVMRHVTAKLARFHELRLRTKLEAYTPERGAMGNEAPNAKEALKRLSARAAAEEAALAAASGMPRTVEEMLARKTMKRRL